MVGFPRLWAREEVKGAYIATVTAVSVVNLTEISPVVSWLWPTAVGVPLIWYWSRAYANKGPLARLFPKA